MSGCQALHLGVQKQFPMSRVQARTPELPTPHHRRLPPTSLSHGFLSSAHGRSIQPVAQAQDTALDPDAPSPSRSALNPAAPAASAAWPLRSPMSAPAPVQPAPGAPGASLLSPHLPCAPFRLVCRAGLFQNNFKCRASFQTSLMTPHLRAKSDTRQRPVPVPFLLDPLTRPASPPCTLL